MKLAVLDKRVQAQWAKIADLRVGDLRERMHPRRKTRKTKPTA